MVTEENDEFTLVKYNSRRQRKNKLKVNKKKLEAVECNSVYSVNEIVNNVNNAVNKFEESPFHQTLLNELKNSLSLLNLNSIDYIICYGLGNFSENICPKYQLAALLSIKTVYSCNVLIYDPLFSKNEIDSLKHLNLIVIENNEEGKHIVGDHPALVFMPHCSKQLTNNFLYANWSPLIHNCILLGNSWSEIECHTTDALLKQTAYHIYKLKSRKINYSTYRLLE
ncbi:SRR1-like protein isoform X2 [Phymastichus coffea]|uniref:SRR1-like protein isoform X2 n=1 Tax=Phymastichus coffea TaxID=108790 RepID=UPI00273B9112|nr:SRR1-like protein isoform X2 [Phymastichus coffea]